jgi:hypothetical protein
MQMWGIRTTYYGQARLFAEYQALLRSFSVAMV